MRCTIAPIASNGNSTDYALTTCRVGLAPAWQLQLCMRMMLSKLSQGATPGLGVWVKTICASSVARSSEQKGPEA